MHIFFAAVSVVIGIVLTLLIVRFFFQSSATPASTANHETATIKPMPQLQRRLITAAILLVLVLIPTLTVFIAGTSAPAWLINPWLQACAVTPIMFYSAKYIHIEGWHAMRSRNPNMMSLASLSLIAAYFYGLVECVVPELLAWNDGQTYFAFVAVITVLMLLAQFVTERWMSHRYAFPMQLRVDRFTAVFVPIVIIIAIWTFIAWLLFARTSPLSIAILCAISVLIIACPCALGWATPLAVSFALRAAHRDHMHIITLDVLQRAQYIRSVIFSSTVARESRDAMTDLNRIGIRTTVLDVHSISALATATTQIENLQQSKNRIALVAFVSDGSEAPSIRESVDISVVRTDNPDTASDLHADVLCSVSDHSHVATLMKLSHDTSRIVRQNLVWTFLFNIVSIPLAAGVLYPLTGWLLNPLWAAIAMIVSSALVLLNSVRLRRFPRPSNRRQHR